MGRYTSVQRFDDNSLVKIPYSQANAEVKEDAEDKRKDGGRDDGDGDIGNEIQQGELGKSGSARPDRVQNVMGSCAGAGSGEFHMYRNHRRKELARLETMDNEEKRKRLIEDQKKKMTEAQVKIAAQSAKRAAKRHKKKQRVKKLKEGVKDNSDKKHSENDDGKKGDENAEEGDEEFTYIPLAEQNLVLENDGGFLERVTASIKANGNS